MSAVRIRSFQQLTERVPAEAHVEVWGDSTVWLYYEGKRLLLREIIDAGFPPIEDWPTDGDREEWALSYGDTIDGSEDRGDSGKVAINFDSPNSSRSSGPLDTGETQEGPPDA